MIRSFALLILLGFSQVGLAEQAATRELVALLSGFESLQGRFEQTIVDQGGIRLQEARGTMIVARGNRFRWHTEMPFEQLALSDGELVSVYDPDLEQLIIRPLGEQSANTPALLFGGDPQKVADAFEVRLVDEHGERRTWQLEPVEPDALFTQLEVTFEGMAPVYMRLEDALGQQTGIQFHDLRLNEAVPAEQFVFTPPEGTDVIRQTE